MQDSKETLFDYKRLTEAFLSNRGIGHMTDTAASVFQNPVLVIDTSYQYLAKSFPKEEANEGQPAPVFSEHDGIEALKKDRIPEMAAQISGLYRYTDSLLQCPAIAAGIRIRNTVVAYLILPEANAELKEDTEALILTFRDLVCQELMKNRFYQSNRDEYISYLLMDMLTGKYPDEKILQQRFETVDFKPADHMNVVVIRKRRENVRSCSMELVAQQLRSIPTEHLTAVLEDSLVMLLNFQSERGFDDTLLEKIDRICVNNDLVAGISSHFCSLSEMAKHYRLATRTALVCQRYIEDHRVIFYDDVFDLALLEYCDRHNNLMDYVHSSILRLMEYDADYGTNYLYTFWVYTECGCSTQATAAKLYVHKNTLLYRVNKIKEILGSDLSSGKDLFAFQLSMRILRMLGKLDK